MLPIERATVDTVQGASSGEELVGLVQEAIRLEFSTIPPYLAAMLSLRARPESEIWSTIHDVVVDEVLHMSIAANLLNALGGRPAVANPGFVPAYPSRLPLGVGTGLVVGLEPFSRDLVRRVSWR